MGWKELAELLLLVDFVLGVALLNMLCGVGDQDPSSVLVALLSYLLLMVPIQLAFFLCLALLSFGHRLPQATANAVAFTSSLAVAFTALMFLFFLASKAAGIHLLS